jgi:FtsZ-interacting cell division protein ZipA
MKEKIEKLTAIPLLIVVGIIMLIGLLSGIWR